MAFGEKKLKMSKVFNDKGNIATDNFRQRSPLEALLIKSFRCLKKLISIITVCLINFLRMQSQYKCSIIPPHRVSHSHIIYIPTRDNSPLWPRRYFYDITPQRTSILRGQPYSTGKPSLRRKRKTRPRSASLPVSCRSWWGWCQSCCIRAW